MRTRLLILFLAILLPLHAQQPLLTTIVGEVYDEQTGQPLQGVNVWFQGTDHGTTTTAEGVFLLRAPLKKKTKMVVSSVGYKKQSFSVSPGMSAGIDVALREQTGSISEVFVTPGDNPALPLMARVRAMRRQNDSEQQAETAEGDLSVYLSGINARHLRRRLWRNMQGAMIDAGDSTMLIPLYNKHIQSGDSTENTALLTLTDWQMLLDDFRRSPAFYHNTVSFCSTSFLSPLASDGNSYYRYYIADSLSSGGKAYLVHVRTKNPYYPTFNGEMLIDSATCALRSISLSVPAEANVNYVRSLDIRQTFSPASQADSSATRFALQDEQVSLLLDMAVKADSSRMFPTVLIKSDRVFAAAGSAAMGGRTESPAYEALSASDSTARMPVFRVATWLAQIITTGYIPTGTRVEIGNVSEILHINPWERVRFGLPLRTNARFSRVVCLEGYAAYGFGDRAWKGAGMLHIQPPAARRHILTLRYADEYTRPDVGTLAAARRENGTWFRDMAFTTHLTEMFYWHNTGTTHFAARRREGSLKWEGDWTENLETTLRLSVGSEGYGTPSHDYSSQPVFRYASLDALVRLGWDERKTDFHFQRRHIYSSKPVLYINAGLTSFHLPAADNYSMSGRLGVMLRQRADLGIGGTLDWLAEAGVILGRTPASRLHVFEGNQSYAFDTYRFSLMYYGTYAADRYLLMHAEWNGRGCLFNLIPGIQRLRLRELLVLKMAYGAWSESRTICLTDNKPASLRVPYVELGAGIGNILRIGNIYAVFRLTHHDDTAPWWAVRFRLHIET